MREPFGLGSSSSSIKSADSSSISRFSSWDRLLRFLDFSDFDALVEGRGFTFSLSAFWEIVEFDRRVRRFGGLSPIKECDDDVFVEFWIFDRLLISESVRCVGTEVLAVFSRLTCVEAIEKLSE